MNFSLIKGKSQARGDLPRPWSQWWSKFILFVVIDDKISNSGGAFMLKLPNINK